MKKVLLLAAALLISANLMADEVVFKLGLDKNKSIEVSDGSGKLTPNDTITLQAEYLGELDENLYLGVGVNVGSIINTREDGDFASLYPVYLAGKYKLRHSFPAGTKLRRSSRPHS